MVSRKVKPVEGIKFCSSFLRGQLKASVNEKLPLTERAYSFWKIKKEPHFCDSSKCWRQPIVPGRCQPSIFSTNELNFCVRYGNRWTLVVINTNYSVCRLIWRLCYNTTSLSKLQAFFQKNFKKFWKKQNMVCQTFCIPYFVGYSSVKSPLSSV